MPGARTVRLTLIGLAALVGCGSVGTGPDALSDSLYVETMVRLLEIREQFTSRDTARAEQARRAALAELGVTLEALQRYAELHGADPERMLRVWESIEARMSAEPDSGAAPERRLEAAPGRVP